MWKGNNKQVDRVIQMKGMVHGTMKIVDLGNFKSDLEILESFVISHQVSFLCVSFCLRV